MTRRLMAGTGWKMNMTAAGTRAYAAALKPLLASIDTAPIDLYVLPPFTSLHAAKEAFADSPVRFGGQNMHWDEQGAWTGEVSAPMLVEAGCTYVELAHSERLYHFGETYDLVRKKLNTAMKHGLTPILCLGEVGTERDEGRADAVLAWQVETALADQPPGRIVDVVLAYEPRWAIGAADAASPDYVAERHAALRAVVARMAGPDAAARTRILYGGSVNQQNGPGLVALPDVDGLFVGRAAWTAQDFAEIARIVAEAARRKSRERTMPDLLLSYYGDDLTGSTDVMEALSSRGVPTVLFMREPQPQELARLDGVRAIGLAGTSRSESPAWMDEHLTTAFSWLKAQGALFCHYKVCSTFDSGPTVGSIGRAIDIGARVFEQDCVPLVVGAAALKRWTAFGQLFAGFRGEVFRIDRHPVMSVHPVTPMDEADLRIHLSRQTSRTIGLVDLPSLGGSDPDAAVDAALQAAPGVLMYDVADLASQRQVGRQLWRTRRPGGTFVAGSSGVEYALLDAWVEEGITSGRAKFDAPGPVDRIAVVSGSCSPTTERQIRHASQDGFVAVALDPRLLAAGGPDGEEARRAIAAGLAALSAGRSVVLYTALGPSTDMGAEIDRDPGARHGIGRALGRIQRRLVEEQGLRRAVIAGGDTSSHALRQLDVFALTTLLPLPETPGSPLCRCSSSAPGIDGLEIALKGGQIGGDDYFSRIRAGRP